MTAYITITRRYEFVAGHFLPNVPPGHRCHNPHGHNYSLEVVVARTQHAGKAALDDCGFIADFYDMDQAIEPLLAKLDHCKGGLNAILGLENPTAENIALWFCERIKFEWPVWLQAVRVFETPDCWATAQVPGPKTVGWR